jgi:hypothetical protein
MMFSRLKRGVPSSHGSEQFLQSASEIGTEAAWKSEMARSEVALAASAPAIRVFIFLAVTRSTMSKIVRMGEFHEAYSHHS